MEQKFYTKLRFCLFLCRLSVALLIFAWAFDKVVRPDHSLGVIREYYHIPITHGLTIALGIFHFIIAGCYMFGVRKKYVTPYVLAIVFMPVLTPKFWEGIVHAVAVKPHPTILFFTTGCTIAAAYLVYRLRDFDTWLSFGKRAESTKTNTMSNSSQLYTRAKDELLIGLFLCRVAVFIVFAVWIYSKLAWPEAGVTRMKNFWLIDGFPEWGVLVFSWLELIIALLFVLGLYKRATRGFFMVLAFFSFSTPRSINGFIRVFEEQAWHTILHFPAFSLFACAVTVYVLRNYDTLFSLNKADKGKQ